MKSVTILNQVLYLAAVVLFYYFKVHLKMNKVQLSEGLVQEALDLHRSVYLSDKRLCVYLEDKNDALLLESGLARLATLLQTEETVYFDTKQAAVAEHRCEFMITFKRSNRDLVVYDSKNINAVTVEYTTNSKQVAIFEKEVEPYFMLLNRPNMVEHSKFFEKLILKHMFLRKGSEEKPMIAEAVSILRRNATALHSLKASIEKVVGENTEIAHQVHYNLKNTFVPTINLLDPNTESLNKKFRDFIEEHDEELYETVPTKAMNILIELSSKPLREDESRKYFIYRNALYLKTTTATFYKDLLRAVQYFSLRLFGLEELNHEFRNIYMKEDYLRVLELSHLVRRRRILRNSLVFLESLQYVNSNPILEIKEQYIPYIDSVLKNYTHILENQDLKTLMKLCDFNNYNFFTSTYMFEQYVIGLLLLIGISGLSPLIKFIKGFLFRFIFSLFSIKEDSTIKKDYGILSAIDWFFERNLVALDEDDLYSLDSEDEDYQESLIRNRKRDNRDENGAKDTEEVEEPVDSPEKEKAPVGEGDGEEDPLNNKQKHLEQNQPNAEQNK